MGYIRPLVQGGVSEDADRRPLMALASGFLASAVLMYLLLWLTGAAVGVGRLSLPVRILAAGAVALVAALADSGRFGVAAPSWRRQTPRSAWAAFGPVRAALIWGLDAGLAFTTYRITSLTWVAMVAVVLHLAPWWSGAAYGLAFVLPTMVDVLLPAGSRDETRAYLSRYANLERPIRWTAMALLLTLFGAATAVGLGAV